MSSRQSSSTPTQLWQSRVDAWQQSGLSVRQFCEEHQLAVASFYHWRRKLSAVPPAAMTHGGNEAPFIQLPTALSSLSSPPAEVVAGNEGWHIVLALGNGMELRLSRGLA